MYQVFIYLFQSGVIFTLKRGHTVDRSPAAPRIPPDLSEVLMTTASRKNTSTRKNLSGGIQDQIGSVSIGGRKGRRGFVSIGGINGRRCFLGEMVGF